MAASKQDFQKLAHELALVRPIRESDVADAEARGGKLTMGLLVSDDRFADVRDGWARALTAVCRACDQMNPAFDEERFRRAALADTYSPSQHGR